MKRFLLAAPFLLLSCEKQDKRILSFECSGQDRAGYELTYKMDQYTQRVKDNHVLYALEKGERAYVEARALNDSPFVMRLKLQEGADWRFIDSVSGSFVGLEYIYKK